MEQTLTIKAFHPMARSLHRMAETFLLTAEGVCLKAKLCYRTVPCLQRAVSLVHHTVNKPCLTNKCSLLKVEPGNRTAEGFHHAAEGFHLSGSAHSQPL
jgi:hypothetical protein